LAVATRSIPPPNTDGDTDSGITWPPVEKLELVWFEKSPPPEDVAENFHLVPLNDVSARPGLSAEPVASAAPPAPAEPPAPAQLRPPAELPPTAAPPVKPARAPEAGPRVPIFIEEHVLESAPTTPVAFASAAARAPVATVERFEPVDQFRFAAPDPVVARVNLAQWGYTVALAFSAVCLLLVIAVMWWRWPATPVQMTQSPAPAAAVADSQVASPAPPTVVQRPASKAATPAPKASPEVRNQHVRPAVAAKPQRLAPRPSAKAKAALRANARPVVPVPTPKPATKAPTPVPPPPETAIASVTPQSITPQPITPQAAVGTPIAIEQPPSRPAPRAASSAPSNTPAAPAVVPAPSDEQRVRAVLRSYQAAFEQFDPGAVRAVWPTVDTKALGRAFDGLSSQSIVFDRCDVSVAAATARAACQGGVEYVKRVGGGGTQSAKRQWIFDLQKSADGAWRIQTLTSR